MEHNECGFFVLLSGPKTQSPFANFKFAHCALSSKTYKEGTVEDKCATIPPFIKPIYYKYNAQTRERGYIYRRDETKTRERQRTSSFEDDGSNGTDLIVQTGGTRHRYEKRREETREKEREKREKELEVRSNSNWPSY